MSSRVHAPRIVVTRTAPFADFAAAVEATRRWMPGAAILVATQDGTEATVAPLARPDCIVTVGPGFFALRRLRPRLWWSVARWRADRAVLVDTQTSGGSLAPWAWWMRLAGIASVWTFRTADGRFHRIELPTERFARRLRNLASVLRVALASRLRARRHRTDDCQRRVLFVAHQATLAGSGRSLVQMLRHLDRERYVPFVCAPGRGPLVDACHALGIETAVIGMGNLLRQKPTRRDVLRDIGRLLDTLPAVIAFIRARQIDVVHTNSLVVTEGTIAAWALALPRVSHFREYLFERPLWRAIQLRFLRLFSSRVVAISDYCARVVMERCKPSQIVRIYNGIDPQEFTPMPRGDARRAENLPQDRLIMVIPGSIAPEKGQDVALVALAQLVATEPKALLVIVGRLGASTYVQGLKQFVEDAGLEQYVRFADHRHDVRPLIAASDFVVIPSVWQEPFGRVAIEGMAMERAVVASRCGGLAEIVVHGETGLLVPPDDPSALAEAMRSLAQDRALRAQMGTRGRARVMAKFHIARTVDLVQRAYEDLLLRTNPVLPRACERAARHGRG